MGFYKENKENFFSDFDYSCISSSVPLEIYVDAILQVFDNISDSYEKIPDLKNIDNIPDEYLQHLSALVGWRQTDYEFNFLTFRDLVKNIIRIYKIKGRPLAYDVFFRAVGYLPTLSELWYDKNGNLVPDKPIGAPNPQKPNNVLNKSNFLQIELDLAFNDPAFPEPLTDGEFITILFEYLKFLKPIHIRYKPILVNVPEYDEDVTVVENAFPVIIVGDKKSPLGVGHDGLFEDQIEGNITDDFEIYSHIDEKDCFLPYFNNTLRFGTSVARSVTINNFQFPVHVIQRQPFKFGECSPLPDDLRIIATTDHIIPEERFELRFNNYVYFNNQVTFDTNKKIEIDDGVKFDSQDLSFGFGNVWSQTPTSGTINSNKVGIF